MSKWEDLFGLTQEKLKNGLREIVWKRRIGNVMNIGRSFMYSFEKQGIVSAGDPDRLDGKANKRKEALRKLADYLRKERGYSEKKIKKFIGESFIEKADCMEKIGR